MTRQTLRFDSVTIHIAAPPARVYELVADITRMGEWSPECYRCEWVGGATGPRVGARFKARNRRRLLRWSNKPTVVVADEGREFAFSRRMPGAGEYLWRYRLTPSPEGGTDVTESYEAVRPERRPNSAFANLFTPGDEPTHLRAGMAETLRRIKEAAEHGRPATPQ
jgi:uncharacterized protein YndB with AHSA1/START domain